MAEEKGEALRSEALQDETLEAAAGGGAFIYYTQSRHCSECGGMMYLRKNESIIDSVIHGSDVWYCTKCGRSIVVRDQDEDEGGYHTSRGYF